MKCKLELKGFEQRKNSGDQAEIRKLIELEMSSLDKGVKAFPPPDGIFLRVVEKVAHKLYHVSVTFDVPGARIAAKHQSGRIASAIRRLCIT